MRSDRPALRPEDLLSDLGWLRRLASSLTHDFDAADDVVQEALIAATTQPAPIGSVRAWLAAIVRNLALARVRAEGRRRVHEAQLSRVDAHAPAADELIERAEGQSALAQFVLALDEPYRSTVLYRFFEGLSSGEIGTLMGVAPATVRWRLASALKELRRRLDDWNRGKSRNWAVLLGVQQSTTAGKAALVAKGVFMAKALKVAIAAIVIFGILFTGALLHRRSSIKTEQAAHSPLSPFEQRAPPPTDELQPSLDWIGQPGVPTRRIAGHVVLEKGAVTGATVTLTTGNNRMLRITDSNGLFDFGTLPAARYQVVATHAQLAPASVEVDSRDLTANPGSDALVLRLTNCRGILVGVVSDSSGGPLAGAEVCEVFGLTGKACAHTRPDGGYELCVGHETNVTVAASASGYGSASLDQMYVGTRSRQDFVLLPEAVLAGKVIDARDGAPIPGALVYVEPSEFGVMHDDRHFATTDLAGRFTFTKLTGGAHKVIAFKDSSVLHPPVGVVLSAGQTMTGLILRLDEFSTISGIVRENGTPVSGARLFGVGTGQGTISQQDGSFVMRLVRRGEVGFEVDGYRVVSPRTIRVDRARVDGVRIDVQAMSSIFGRVLLDGQGVEGATVRVGDEFDGPSTTTNARGEYQLRGLPAQTYRVTAESADARGYVESVIVGESETHGGVDIVLNDAATISGTVLDTHGRPVVGAFVKFQATANGDSGDAVTGVEGDFKVGKLAGGGSYIASVKPLSLVLPDLKAPSDHPFPTVVVRDSQAHVNGVQLIVQRGELSISGTVVDGSGEVGGADHLAFEHDGKAVRPNVSASPPALGRQLGPPAQPRGEQPGH